MIFISSASLKEKNLNNLLKIFKKNKLYNIELSGGTKFNQKIFSTLKRHSKEMNFGVHNYFPPPKRDFIINLGSLNEKNRIQSVNLCKKAIQICKKLNIKKYAIHAPFLIDFEPNEAGKLIKRRKLSNKKKVIEKFSESWRQVKRFAGKDVTLYLENNVLSLENYKSYKNKNPFFLTDYNSYKYLNKKIDFKLLLDLGHLLVSCRTLKKNFFDEAIKLSKYTDYFHISDNNEKQDENKSIKKNGKIFKILNKKIINKDATLTLEIYESINIIKKNINLINQILK